MKLKYFKVRYECKVICNRWVQAVSEDQAVQQINKLPSFDDLDNDISECYTESVEVVAKEVPSQKKVKK